MRSRPDRGQAALLVVGVVAVMMAFVLALAAFGRHVVDASRARTAADAAALAGVHGGRPSADRLARENGGVLVHYSSVDRWVQVVVEVGDVTATARAEELT